MKTPETATDANKAGKPGMTTPQKKVSPFKIHESFGSSGKKLEGSRLEMARN
jgi:hypothetical protein